ncbi:flavin reductase family protein [Candidatus Enterococcus ikei]|uniref:Flavin reductase family protein n=1 Tax=Candidatus Enterococcus ikei TaxID=2815326 RepID=A0ABS3GXH5_9ENTE|nr:flavin reductase family protein [Enterococcus sp. DIV0869a]MBO0439966.1 flavin reductase family protein [Enterococcus sp. DIV0869a]
MLHYPTKFLSAKQAYKFLSGSIIPRPIAWVTTLNKNHETVNAAPFSFFNAAASDIPLVTLSILRRDGEIKDTARNIIDTKELVIHLVNDQVVESMNQTAASLTADQSEIIINKIETTASNSVTVSGIKAAPIRMEARLHQYVPIKNHDDQIITDLFIVEITDFYFDEAIFDQESEYILPEVFKPIARLAGNTYAHIDSLFDLKRPN